jgi:tetrahydromethanopterin S-methyltransferase subunit E
MQCLYNQEFNDVEEVLFMVTCTKCGAQNDEGAKFCVSCGARLEVVREKHRDTCFGQPRGRIENECFGLPYGGAIIGIIIGMFILLYGIAMLLGQDLSRYTGPFFVIIIGLLIVAGAIYGILRRTR